MFVLPLLAALGTTPTLDRIVAVVDDEPIFLSELRRREVPFLKRGAPVDEVEPQLLERMIDEKLEAREAEKAHLTVSSAEVDSGIQMIVAQAKLTLAQLLEEVKKQGMTEAEYREEIRRQVLEGKLIQLRVRGRVNVTDADARAVYDKWVKEQSGAPAAPIPTFEKVKEDMKQRAFLDATERERTAWLQGLRKQAYIEVKK